MSDTKKCISTLNMEKVSAVLLDVAGTTTAMSFVKETLYPYVIKNVEEFLKSSWENEDVQKAISRLEEKDLDVTKATEVIKKLTEAGDSNEGLKTVQGLLWKKGYESGEIKGHVFEDVSKFFESLSTLKKIAIFSSGSVESQQLLFKNSSEGDLTSHIKKFFDLSVGSKTDSETYIKIAKELDVVPADILFLTDDVKEAECAKSADVKVVLVEREGNTPLTEESQANFSTVKSLAEISVEKMKRKIVEDPVEEPPTKIAKVEMGEVTEDKAVTEKSKVDEAEEKKDVETSVETMEVDHPATDKVEEENTPSEVSNPDPAKTAQKEEKEELNKKPEEEVTKPEAMEVDSKETEIKKDRSETNETSKATEQKPSSEELSTKAEIEIGTQTKCAVTNECETQTTISIAAIDELPIEEVQDKLMDTKTGATEEPDTVEKEENKDTIVLTEETDSVQVEKSVNVEKINTEAIEKKNEEEKNTPKEIEEAKSKDEIVETEKETDKVEELKQDNKEVKENGNLCEKSADQSKTAEKVDTIENGDAEKTETVEKKNIQENAAITASKENGVKEEVSEKEKENKSQLANGKGSEVPNGEVSEQKNGALEQNEEEIKLKKIGENVESAAVSVEV